MEPILVEALASAEPVPALAEALAAPASVDALMAAMAGAAQPQVRAAASRLLLAVSVDRHWAAADWRGALAAVQAQVLREEDEGALLAACRLVGKIETRLGAADAAGGSLQALMADGESAGSRLRAYGVAAGQFGAGWSDRRWDGGLSRPSAAAMARGLLETGLNEPEPALRRAAALLGCEFVAYLAAVSDEGAPGALQHAVLAEALSPSADPELRSAFAACAPALDALAPADVVRALLATPDGEVAPGLPGVVVRCARGEAALLAPVLGWFERLLAGARVDAALRGDDALALALLRELLGLREAWGGALEDDSSGLFTAVAARASAADAPGAALLVLAAAVPQCDEAAERAPALIEALLAAAARLPDAGARDHALAFVALWDEDAALVPAPVSAALAACAPAVAAALASLLGAVRGQQPMAWLGLPPMLARCARVAPEQLAALAELAAALPPDAPAAQPALEALLELLRGATESAGGAMPAVQAILQARLAPPAAAAFPEQAALALSLFAQSAPPAALAAALPDVVAVVRVLPAAALPHLLPACAPVAALGGDAGAALGDAVLAVVAAAAAGAPAGEPLLGAPLERRYAAAAAAEREDEEEPDAPLLAAALVALAALVPALDAERVAGALGRAGLGLAAPPAELAAAWTALVAAQGGLAAAPELAAEALGVVELVLAGDAPAGAGAEAARLLGRGPLPPPVADAAATLLARALAAAEADEDYPSGSEDDDETDDDDDCGAGRRTAALGVLAALLRAGAVPAPQLPAFAERLLPVLLDLAATAEPPPRAAALRCLAALLAQPGVAGAAGVAAAAVSVATANACHPDADVCEAALELCAPAVLAAAGPAVIGPLLAAVASLGVVPKAAEVEASCRALV